MIRDPRTLHTPGLASAEQSHLRTTIIRVWLLVSWGHGGGCVVLCCRHLFFCPSFRFRSQDAASSGSGSPEPGWEALLPPAPACTAAGGYQALPHCLMKQKSDVKIQRGVFLPLLSE